MGGARLSLVRVMIHHPIDAVPTMTTRSREAWHASQDRMSEKSPELSGRYQSFSQLLPKAGFSSPMTLMVLPQTFTGT
jgi:hypothetical protein